MWIALIALVALLFAGVPLALAWAAAEALLHPAPVVSSPSLDQYPALRLEVQPVHFHSQTGVTIAGRFFRGRSRATIILSPGYGETQDSMLPWADFLHRSGFNVLTYDMRGTGGSSGQATLGLLESRDLISAAGYISSRRDVGKQEIGALGLSIGGVTTILAAARDTNIKAVVDDSGFDDVRHWLDLGIIHSLLHPADPLGLLSVEIARFRLGLDVTSIRPMDKIGLISPRPVLVIQGTADTVVRPREGEANFQAARVPKQLWLVPGAAHGRALFETGNEYRRRVVRFFQRAFHLLAPQTRAAGLPEEAPR